MAGGLSPCVAGVSPGCGTVLLLGLDLVPDAGPVSGVYRNLLRHHRGSGFVRSLLSLLTIQRRRRDVMIKRRENINIRAFDRRHAYFSIPVN